MDSITLKKYHGLGNDYLVLDPNRNDLVLQTRNIEMICRRNFGVGADGLLYGPIMENGKIKVRIFNPDGSEAEKSGLKWRTDFCKISAGCRICKGKKVQPEYSGRRRGN